MQSHISVLNIFVALMLYEMHPSDLVHNGGCPFHPAPEHGILRLGPATVLNAKMQMAVGKMWHNISAGNIVLVLMVT
jgi:hypothetical protein